ncbi:response regulator transcription factor [Shewanella aestuarii]|uniref:response regulator transcription factor n=1 Tax=Shewanella aestuarii TaxID=1028752 RepID=UPI001FCBC39D|nr:response regulator transcription factor [Shewanella aestuarii]
MAVEQILLIDKNLEHQFSEQLVEVGFNIYKVDNALMAMNQLKENTFQAILLDLSIPRLDSFTFLMAKKCTTPIIALADKDTLLERLNAFELGVDDYLSKPHDLRELQLRLKVIKRHTSRQQPLQQSINIEFDDEQFKLYFQETQIELTHTEFRLFKYLYDRQPTVVTKAELQQRVLHKSLGKFDRNLDMHISNTRRKLAQGNLPRELINTVRGKGYSICF